MECSHRRWLRLKKTSCATRVDSDGSRKAQRIRTRKGVSAWAARGLIHFCFESSLLLTHQKKTLASYSTQGMVPGSTLYEFLRPWVTSLWFARVSTRCNQNYANTMQIQTHRDADPRQNIGGNWPRVRWHLTFFLSTILPITLGSFHTGSLHIVSQFSVLIQSFRVGPEWKGIKTWVGSFISRSRKSSPCFSTIKREIQLESHINQKGNLEKLYWKCMMRCWRNRARESWQENSSAPLVSFLKRKGWWMTGGHPGLG